MSRDDKVGASEQSNRWLRPAMFVGLGLVGLALVGRLACGRGESASTDTGASQGASDASSPGSSVPAAVEKTIREYAAQKDCRARARAILDPERNAEVLRAFYGARKTTECTLAISSIAPGTSDDCSTVPVGGYCTALVSFDKAPDAVRFDLKRVSADEFKIDWRALARFNPMDFSAFQAARPAKPTTFRVHAQLDDQFLSKWSGLEASFYSLKVFEPVARDGSPKKTMRAYVKRDGAEALASLLQDGQPHDVMLAVSHRDGAPAEMVDARVVRLDWRQAGDE